VGATGTEGGFFVPSSKTVGGIRTRGQPGLKGNTAPAENAHEAKI
jgi:hypothetical protein